MIQNNYKSTYKKNMNAKKNFFVQQLRNIEEVCGQNIEVIQ